jgi:uncharacterized repeat protein (TIGR01451 family)
VTPGSNGAGAGGRDARPDPDSPAGGSGGAAADADADAGSDAGADGRRGVRREGPTYRLEAAVAAAVVAAAVGTITGSAVALLVALVGVGYALYARVAALPDAALRVERRVTPRSPAPGEAVTVRLAVHNDGPDAVADLRVVDGVPPALGVVSGTARRAVALRPGETATVEYDLRAKRGEHAFGPATLVTRSVGGTRERVARRGPSTRLACARLVDGVPLRSRALRRAGRLAVDAGGSGVEFHATRDYRPGDPMRRVDWKRLARAGELTTVEFREERAATVVLVVDARSEADVAPDPASPGAVDLCTYAAGLTYETLAAEGHRVGLAVLADGGVDWLAPGTGERHDATIRRALDAVVPGGVDDDALADLVHVPVPVAVPGEGPGERGDDHADPAPGDGPAPADGSENDPDESAPVDPPRSGVDELFDRGRGRAGNGAAAGDARRPDGGSDRGSDDGAAARGGGRPDADDAADAGGGASRTAEPPRARVVRRRLSPAAGAFAFTPATDRPARATARWLATHGHPVTVVSPDPTGEGTPGGVLAAAERERRLASLRRAGLRVVDWPPTEAAAVALGRAFGERTGRPARERPGGDEGGRSE